MTKKLEKSLPAIGNQEGLAKDAICFAHFFYGSWDWYVLEYDFENKIFFGIVIGSTIEYGEFSLEELQNSRVVERDLYWNNCKIGEIDKLEEFLSDLYDNEQSV